MMNIAHALDEYCLHEDLSTYDPYDIWTTKIGFCVKSLFNRNYRAGIVPAGILAIIDTAANSTVRVLFKKREYPIVRAFAAQIILNQYRRTREECLLGYAKKHLEWLVENSCRGFHGYCWGLGWKYPVSKNLVYDANAPYSTVTPYALEAFTKYSTLSADDHFTDTIRRISWFFERDIYVLEETDDYLITSYGAMRDRIAYNAVAYSMYSFALLLEYLPAENVERTVRKIRKMYNYIRDHQADDGSWYYSPEGRSFIDCFHSCFVLKNIYKTAAILPLHESDRTITRGYDYLRNTLFDDKMGLFRRFAVKNKPSIIRYDLYDNAEMLNLAALLNDRPLAVTLADSIERRFCAGSDVFSQIDVLGMKRYKNTLRWALMPYLYALSELALL